MFNDLTYSGMMYSITQIYRHGVYEKAPFTKYQQDDQGGHRVLKAQSALLGSQKEGGLFFFYWTDGPGDPYTV